MDHYKPEIGTPVEQLDTPCLIVDMDAYESNLRVVAETYRDTSVKMRAHTKNLKSPFLAQMQIDMGGTVGGVCVAKVSEAEVMVENGITDILIPNQVVTDDKLGRLCTLAQRGDIKVCVDDPENVQTISRVAEANGVTIGILIEVDTSMARGGVRNPQQGVDIAKLTTDLPGVRFMGVMSHQHVEGWPTVDEYTESGTRHFGICLAVKDAIEAEGMAVEMVSSGETFSYKLATEIPGVTEVEGGTYALMDTMLGFMTEFKYAAKLLTTVVSTPRPNVAITDIGARQLCLIGGEYGPDVEGLPGVEVSQIGDEHLVLKSDGQTALGVGDVVTLIPGYADGLVNRWDQFVAVRNGLVEGTWDFPGRGCFH
jgi:D-serine deaminase-like pyridoxal phosphate-dependent protein